MLADLVLVPGLASDADCWMHQIDGLKDVARTRVADLAPCRSRREMTEAVLAQAPERFVLAGNSMGAWVAQEVAARAPERVSSLILVATWTRPDPAFNDKQREAVAELRRGRFEEVMRPHARAILGAGAQENGKLLETLYAMQDRIGAEVIARHIQAMIDSYDASALLPTIMAPTLVIAGRQDPLFSLEEHAYIAAHIARGRLAIIEDCGHVAQMEQPQAVTALMRYWIDYGPLEATPARQRESAPNPPNSANLC